jgi:hypothetical protein
MDAPMWMTFGSTSTGTTYSLATNARGDVTQAYLYGAGGAANVREEQQLDVYGEKALYKRDTIATNFVTCVQGKENNGYSYAEQGIHSVDRRRDTRADLA